MFRIILQNQHPLLKIMMLFCLLLLMTALSFSLSTLVISHLNGLDLAQAGELMSDTASAEGRNAIRWSNTCFQLFAFLGSALIFRAVFGHASVLGFRVKYFPVFALLAPLLIVASAPIIEGSLWLNEWLIPEGSSIANWGMPLQEQADATTEAILGDGTGPIWTNLILMAFIPALCEEFFFRGALQIQLAKATRNVHAGIWITAILFAATHMQIYGFLPRMLIGALLGYLVIWTGSIWTAVLAHFANNAIALWAMRVMLSEGGMDPVADSVSRVGPLIFYALLFLALLYFMLRNSKWPGLSAEYLSVEKQDVDAYLAERYGRKDSD